ncbi:hypothetical protein [Vibrio genomosp. F10]|uniref:hypothetical protein n=1 Tax=Vibrio genomosp. F10 TaxID=723171 RepID=UPI0004747D2D|nr:hypothetical protein [Vibrio genomosp. F10]OEF06849.1 hypothetical protein A1QI_18335 [Vibrio genomosp. F10 str. 9ZB36]
MNKIVLILGIAVSFSGGYFLGSSSSNTGNVGNSIGFPLLEVPIGDAFPAPALENYNASVSGIWVDFRVPLPSNTNFTFLSDYKVTLDRESGVVARVAAERAFPNKNECMEAISAFSSEFSKTYPEFNLLQKNSNHLEVVKDLEFSISCTVYEKSPYYSFEYSLSSISVVENIVKRLQGS